MCCILRYYHYCIVTLWFVCILEDSRTCIITRSSVSDELWLSTAVVDWYVFDLFISIHDT